jgi:hypothetical protein
MGNMIQNKAEKIKNMRRKKKKQRCQFPLSEAFEAIRVVNHFYEAMVGNSKIVAPIMDIEEHLENQYLASHRRRMKVTDYLRLA